MNTNRHESEDSLLHGELVFRIVGWAFEVIKDIGHGLQRITDHERGQMLNYLKITGHRVGLIVNFKRAKIEWERVVP